jgi:hypothetical protein
LLAKRAWSDGAAVALSLAPVFKANAAFAQLFPLAVHANHLLGELAKLTSESEFDRNGRSIAANKNVPGATGSMLGNLS